MRRILVTSALPYANGSIHIGHLVEYIQTDIWVRFQQLCGHEVHYVCADDTHGTPVMLRAERENTTPEELINRVSIEHKEDFKSFLIKFDHYGSTNSDANRDIANEIYLKLRDRSKLISKKPIEQFYDPEKSLFLPDRFIKGTCPKCNAEDQYGDTCEKCGATYAPTDLLNPYSVVSGVKPILKKSEHYFFCLSDEGCFNFLKNWVMETSRLQKEARNKILEWFKEGFQDWDISRDAPYFGFEIPDAPGKFFYVWLDAPIGYLGAFKELCVRENLSFDDFFDPKESESQRTELIHFIGKDILYFHALFFPAVLHFAGYRTPSQVFAHGFLTVNGQKMSKSRGTFITAQSFVNAKLDPQWLRYYYFSKLNASLEDMDLNFEEFVVKINGDLVGKYINIASRSAKFINKNFGSQICTIKTNELLEKIKNKKKDIEKYYEEREFSKVAREVMELANNANQYIDSEKPWHLVKTDMKKLQEVCSSSLEAFRILSLYLKPVLPDLVTKVEQFLNIKPLAWEDINVPLENNHKIKPYYHLMQRAKDSDVRSLLGTSNNEEKRNTTKSKELDNLQSHEKKGAHLITIDQFNKVELRVARITNVESVEGADKLLKLELDLGAHGKRQVFSGIKESYSPDRLINKLTVVVANLKPRKMRFGLSEGMILAASMSPSGIFIISPDEGATPGMKVT